MRDFRLDFSFKSHESSDWLGLFALLPFRKPKPSRTLSIILKFEPILRNFSDCLFWLGIESSTTSSIESSWMIVGVFESINLIEKHNFVTFKLWIDLYVLTFSYHYRICEFTRTIHFITLLMPDSFEQENICEVILRTEHLLNFNVYFLCQCHARQLNFNLNHHL